jgi:hypothetical protein
MNSKKRTSMQVLLDATPLAHGHATRGSASPRAH